MSQRDGPSAFGFRLRPVTGDDAEFILGLRTDPERAHFLHSTSPDVGAQRQWIAEQVERPDDHYFIVERIHDGRDEGTVGLYGGDGKGAAEWGRWVLRSDSLAAAASAWLIYKFGFEDVGLDHIFCRTLVENTKVIAFHDACGLQPVESPRPTVTETDGPALVEHWATLEMWPQLDEYLTQRARRAAELTER